MDYEPHNVLITGAAGFIGSHVIHALLREFPSCRITALDKLDVCSSLKNIPPTIHRFVAQDLCDGPDELLDLLKQESIDTVMHFAAHTHVDNSFGNSLEFTINNTFGTHVLLEACRAYNGIKRFINVSTDEVYGEALEKTNEDSVLDPTNPYAAAKAGAELIARAYHSSFGIPIITTRGNNVYGPGQYPEKVIPKFLMRALQRRPLEVHGNGSAVRSFVFVDDVADAYITILKKGRVGDIYNIGSQHEMSVLELAKSISKTYGVPIKYVRDRAFNDRRYFICDSKLAALGWTPTTPWADGMAMTMEWYASNATDHWGKDVEAALSAHP